MNRWGGSLLEVKTALGGAEQDRLSQALWLEAERMAAFVSKQVLESRGMAKQALWLFPVKEQLMI